MPGSIQRLILTATMAVTMAGGAMAAAPAAEAQTVLSAADRATALEQVQAWVRSNYVYPDRRAAIIDRLAAGATAGRYDTPDPAVFAQRVSEDLQATNKDSHLYLRYEPDWHRSALAPPQPGEDEKQIAAERDIARYTNHGLVETKILPGNIRYLKVEGFDWVEGETGQAYDDAMRFLKGGRAVIIDLRGNGGGWVQASKYLISHFLDADTLIATFYRADGEAEQYRAIDYLPAGRIKGRPIYILIDGHSRSAAEMVAYTFDQYKLGELVGARTEGAANVSDDFPVAPGFRLSVSTGRTVQPISKTDWEGVGVPPTIPADPAQALEVAQLHAIDRLLPSTPDGVPRYQLQWARPAIEAKLHPATLTEADLKAFAGIYGTVSITFDNHALWLRRPERPPSRLTPMTRDGLFQSADNSTLRVKVGGGALDILRVDPAFSERHPRAAH